MVQMVDILKEQAMIDKDEFIKRLRREMDADHIKYVSIDYVERVLNTMKVKDEQQTKR